MRIGLNEFEISNEFIMMKRTLETVLRTAIRTVLRT